MSALLVITNLPDRAAAETLADALIEKRVAACINILAPCWSVYRWQGAVQHDEEHPVLIKTTREAYPELEAQIRAHHPYELPEIIARRSSLSRPIEESTECRRRYVLRGWSWPSSCSHFLSSIWRLPSLLRGPARSWTLCSCCARRRWVT
jgi:periplasmic divalent cation tolerance protein